MGKFTDKMLQPFKRAFLVEVDVMLNGQKVGTVETVGVGITKASAANEAQKNVSANISFDSRGIKEISNIQYRQMINKAKPNS